ncbi:tetratricopeptide repeat protein [Sunxiuqinia sp. sy24]|uniref:tetratricopeptide repeat protein n=1 Tax=Sunxiuqinia sp. sy24 TaxID=3461495 RepID=UPI00404643C0
MILKRLTYFLVLTLVFISCSTVQKQLVAEPVVEVDKEDELSEDQRNEFEYLFIEGLKQKKLGNVQNAVSIFSRCLEIDPNSSVAMYEMASIHYANKDLTSASLLLEKAISINADNKWYKLMLAEIYRQRQQFKEAAVLYTELSAKEPENKEFLYYKAVLLGMSENYSEALTAYDQLEKKTGLNEQISVAKQQLYIKQDQPDRAFEEINRLIESNPTETQYYGLMAEFYQQVGDSVNALNYFNKILDIDPENGFVHFSLANFYIEQGDKEMAFDHIKKAFANTELDAESKIQYYMLQTSDAENSEWTNDQIGELLDILHAAHPDDNRMYTIYAEHLMRQNKIDEARNYLKQYLETDKDNFVIWQQLLFMDNDLMDFESLYTNSKAAIELFPNQAVSYALHAVAALQLKKYEEVLAIVDEGEAYVLDNQSLKIQFELYKAEANYNLDQVDEAFKAFDKVIKLDPNNYMAINNYAYYLSVRGQQLEKAERLSGKVVQANPENPTYLDTYAWVLFKRENYLLAKFYIETAISNGGSENSVLLEHYGDILYKLGETDKALENWKKAQALGEGTEVLDQKIKESRFIESLVP